MALYHFTTKPLSRRTRNTVRAVAYRAGCKLYDERTGESFDYRQKDVEHVELLLPKNAPPWTLEIQKLMTEDRSKGVQAFCDIVEGAEKRVDARVWREFEFALHRELTKEQNMTLAREFVQDQICARDMAAQLNFHFDVDKETGDEKPHCHVVMATRRLEEKGWGIKKEEVWNTKELLKKLRIQWQDYSNFHLKLYGHDICIDHRCNKDRGIEMEPQPKMSRGLREQEKRLQELEKTSSPITDKAKVFKDVQLRNLYRIMRRPDVVLDIVTKHHSTFMWADVQKVLHRYVDEVHLFQKLESKLKNSNELMLLRSNPEGQDIYTTRTMLKAEKALVEHAEALGKVKTHGVQENHIAVAMTQANEKLKKHGGLSEDQKKAITHMVDEGQIKCIVGIAGAGKTTAIGVCHAIWKESGYAVYGLAPTGKAAQNLEQNGISSSTLHKFLKLFEEGRCRYNPNTILVLDEAGMVDMERFEQLLGAVQTLGIKLIVVGDGAQLQPVEAGPAFRLVTARLGKSELNTVIRQKEGWQKEATVLFGKQETQAAIQKYINKGYVHIVEEKLPEAKHSLYDDLDDRDRADVLKLYEIASRSSALIYREMMRDISKTNSGGSSYTFITRHPDFERYQEWKSTQKSAASQIITDGALYRPLLEERSLDPLKMAMLFVDNKQDKATQRTEAMKLLEQHDLKSLIGVKKLPGQSIDTRIHTKAALIKAWHEKFEENSEKSSLMLSFSNRDTNDLNRSARALLKESGHLSKEDFTYTICKQFEDDFGREYIIRESKDFAKGDRIVFTRNTNGLGVKNGTMGTIIKLDKQTVKVKLEEGREVSFAPNLNPYFDQGWAITIHKSQGTTVDQTYLLASYEMTQNLTYVAMTRHQENVQIFGSSLDFWRSEKLPEVLSKSGEKLSPGDYLDADSLSKLMQQDDRLLTKIFNRIANELEAMGAVSKKAFWQVADHFLGIKRENEIRVMPDFSNDGVREEIRAEKLLKGLVNENTNPSEQPIKTSGEKIFEDLTQQCREKLYAYLGEEKISLTPDLIKRIEKQAEKAANYIFHTHTLKKTKPTEKQTEHFLLRAKYELNRIPEIRDEIITGWKKVNSYRGEKDALIAHLIAERQASVEGRLYLEAKQKSLTLSSKISELAKKEIKQNKTTTTTIAEKLAAKQRLSESAALFCAKEIIRYTETHGQKPSTEQISAMAQISKDLEKRGYDSAIGSHNVEYLRRREGDLRFRGWTISNKDLSGFKEFPYAVQEYPQIQVRGISYGEEKKVNQQTHEKIYEMDLSI